MESVSEFGYRAVNVTNISFSGQLAKRVYVVERWMTDTVIVRNQEQVQGVSASGNAPSRHRLN